MTRRRATIVLHWINMLLLIFLVAGGPMPLLAWSFVVSGLAMIALALGGGLLNGPGPKLDGALRMAHPWFSWAMYLALGLVVLFTTLEIALIRPAPIPLPQLYFYLLSASSLHAVFHLWRHTALGDGALRRITPSILHGIL